MMNRRIFVGVTILQVVGATATCTWEIAPDALGPTLWATSFLALLPGDVVGPWLVEAALWQRASLRLIAVVDLVSAIAFNLALTWFLLAATRRLRRAA